MLAQADSLLLLPFLLCSSKRNGERSPTQNVRNSTTIVAVRGSTNSNGSNSRSQAFWWCEGDEASSNLDPAWNIVESTIPLTTNTE